ncbi:hypothetical protein JXM67_02070 [candidate division WOR-3 bacterium]|nr:hypothetical protein [candidate division WOR-3 bacterium]
MKEIISFEPPETMVVNFKGNLDPADVGEMFKRWSEYVKKAGIKKSKILMDLSGLENIPPKSREIFRLEGSRYPISKMSIFGASTKIRIMGGLLLKLSSSVDESKFFDTEEDARVWLREE